jgi:hypothetical protein
MSPAVSRCNRIYREDNASCIQIHQTHSKKSAPMVSLACPANHSRQGCCTCLRDCSAPGLVNEGNSRGAKQGSTHNLRCQKKKIEESNILTYAGYKSLDSAGKERYELNEIINKFAEKCTAGFLRVGVSRCVPVCPVGWPDLGEYCRRGDSLDLVPFVWTLGDGVE